MSVPARAMWQQRPAPVAPPAVHQALASPGRPLDPGVRGDMEERFGHDFSQVRVHADASAAASARSVGALAYTVGSDVVFGEGRFAPTSPSGSRLLAHELAHTVQQRGAGVAAGAIPVRRAGDPAEHEADRAGAAVASGGPAGPISSESVGVPNLQRQPAPCPTCHAPTGVQNVDVDDLRSDDRYYLPDENAIEFNLYLRAGYTWNTYKKCNLESAQAVRVAQYGGDSAIVGYILQFTNPQGSNYSYPTLGLDVYGNLVEEKWHSRDYVESVMSPLDFIGPAFLERLGVSAIRGVESGAARFLTRSRAVLGSTMRSTALATRLYGGSALSATMRGFEAAAPAAITGGAVDPAALVLRSGGELAVASQEAAKLTEFLEASSPSVAGTLRQTEASVSSAGTSATSASAATVPRAVAGATGGLAADVTLPGSAVPEAITDEPTNPLQAGAEIGEQIGDFNIVGDKALKGDTFEREIWGLRGPAKELRTAARGVGPLLRFFKSLMAEARAAGATKLRIVGRAVINPNILEMRPIVEKFGGTFRQIDEMTVEMEIPLSKEAGK